MIPNIVHFIFGLSKDFNQEFLFVHYLSIYSVHLINKPQRIYIYYHYQPNSIWWEKLKDIPELEFCYVELPKYIGQHIIKKYAHRADKLRMDILYNTGGIYMDIDTICVKPYNHLLQYETVLGLEHSCKKDQLDTKKYKGICNAIMFTKAKSVFFTEWLKLYGKHFCPNGWAEASIILPKKIADEKFKNNDRIKILSPEYFFSPHWTEFNKIFIDKYNIPEDLITLHYWSTTSHDLYKKIKNWDWMNNNSHTLFGKIMLKLHKLYAP